MENKALEALDSLENDPETWTQEQQDNIQTIRQALQEKQVVDVKGLKKNKAPQTQTDAMEALQDRVSKLEDALCGIRDMCQQTDTKTNLTWMINEIAQQALKG